MSSNNLAHQNSNSRIALYLEGLKRLVRPKNKLSQLSKIFEKLLLAQAILGEEAASNDPEALFEAMELFSYTLNKLLNLSSEGLSHLVVTWIDKNQDPVVKNSIVPYTLTLFHINDAIIPPFFKALNIAIKISLAITLMR